MADDRLQLALQQICRARAYTLELLKHFDKGQWFWQPSEGVTHVAWQVGHLAMAEYGLALKRVRGEQPDDEEFIPAAFRRQFGKGSTPDPDPNKNPTVDEIQDVLTRVHQRVIAELRELPEKRINEPTGPPGHPMFSTKLESLHWCAQHELIHAGQIGLLRRLSGSKPLR